ncbi:MAG: hypothetical protein J5753_04875 [Oscillospiraceae bacterium]|nr:hypothetical protein [Oscillospiraceae bacterium]
MIHASENQKRTPCGIYYTRPENLKNFPTIGEMTDVMQITCEKCKTVIAKHLIRESNKEMAAQLKEEQRMLKRERANSKHRPVAPPPVQAPAQEQHSSGGYIPPSMRKSMAQQQQPIDTPPPPPPAPISIPAPNVAPSAPAAATAEDALSQFNVPTSIPGMMPRTAPANDVLSQFAVPGPQSAPAAPLPAAPVPANDVLAQFAVPVQPSAPAPQHAAPVPANDVLAQFAVPGPQSAPAAPQHAAPVPANDVLAQFAVPGPQSAPAAPKPAVPVPANDVLAQFAVPAQPSAPAPQPAAPKPINDVFAQFALPSAPAALSAPAAPAQNDILAQFAMPTPGSADASVMNSPEDILAQFSGGQPSAPAAQPAVEEIPSVEAEIDELRTLAANAFAKPEKPVDLTPVPDVQPAASVEDSLNDLLLMPSGSGAPQFSQPVSPTVDAIPELTNVPTAGFANPAIPSLDLPPVPPAPPVPQMPVPPVSQQPAAPFMQPQVQQQPVHNALFTAPSRMPARDPKTPTPLFVGYSADGRQVFQNFDALGNPIPITEPVYSAPPEQPKYNPAAEASAMMNHAIQNNGPVLDMDELMASMGIETPAVRKQKQDSGKPINYTEYKIPEKKSKKKTPASAQPAPMPTLEAMGGPVSAAEAKRRKKVDKINKEFEKQLRSRGIDPRTGGIILDSKK